MSGSRWSGGLKLKTDASGSIPGRIPIGSDKMPIYKRCPRCGARLPAGETCGRCKRFYPAKPDDIYARFYQSRDWHKARALCMSRMHGLDWYEYLTAGRLVPGETVHHIVPLRDDWSLRLAPLNLICLTNQNHQLVHIELSAGGERREAVIKRLREALRLGLNGGEGE